MVGFIEGMVGKAPTVKVSNERPLEKDLYKKVWEMPEYRKVSPGEKISHIFSAAFRFHTGLADPHLIALGWSQSN